MISVNLRLFFFIIFSLTLHNLLQNSKETSKDWYISKSLDSITMKTIKIVINHTLFKTALKDRYNILAELVPLNIGYKLSSRLQCNTQQRKLLSFLNSNSKSDSNGFEINPTIKY